MTDEEDRGFMAWAVQESERSDDRSTKTGCVVVSADGKVHKAIGVNAFPRGVDKRVEARHERPEKYLWIEHAERNAIYAAARRGVKLDGSLMYLSWFPCMDCARAIIQSGIVEVVCREPDFSHERWGDQFKRVVRMLEEAGVCVRHLAP